MSREKKYRHRFRLRTKVGRENRYRIVRSSSITRRGRKEDNEVDQPEGMVGEENKVDAMNENNRQIAAKKRGGST